LLRNTPGVRAARTTEDFLKKKEQSGDGQKLAALLFVLLIGIGLVVWVYWPKKEAKVAPEQLVEEALNGESPHVRQQAVYQLTAQREVPQLRRVLKEGRTPELKVAAVQGLARAEDIESAPGIFDLLDDPDPNVRGQAGAALTAMLGEDYFFSAEDPPQKRRAVAASMRKRFEQLKQHPKFKNRQL
jgi:cbb3-type cytochrome oxidase subunit 3